MDDPFAICEQQVEAIAEECTDPWFAEHLAACRSGDDAACRQISARCLRLVLQLTKRTWKPGARLSMLDLVQEGNWEMLQTIREFEGGAAEEFLRELARRVENRLIWLLEHPAEETMSLSEMAAAIYTWGRREIVEAVPLDDTGWYLCDTGER